MDLDVEAFRAGLLEWFDAGRRDLPWRRTSDPYRIWVSEVMLQQTQVDRVVDYYTRFLEAFPTVEALAAAPIDDVLKRWEGLGYYARARTLHAAAARVAGDLDGRLPARAEELQALPGFGPYTSAAVASIAFGEAVAAVDTNVVRVVARLGCASSRAAIDRPRCLLCPVAAGCCARASGTPERWPEPKPTVERPVVHAACGVVRRRGRVLVVRRPERGLLGGLWEFPGARLADGETPERACERGIAEKTGVRATALEPLGAVGHTFSHFKVVLHAFACRDLGGRARAGRWATLDEIDALALTRTARSILSRLSG